MQRLNNIKLKSYITINWIKSNVFGSQKNVTTPYYYRIIMTPLNFAERDNDKSQSSTDLPTV